MAGPNLVNPLDKPNNQNPDTMAASDTESVVSDLSTDQFRESLHKDLCGALEAMTSPGSFASFLKITPEKFNAEIVVDGVGKINTPLQEDQARQLIEKARQAPFGKGSETVVDTSIRNTWELDPAQFHFVNSEEWMRNVDKYIAKVSQCLGISSPITAELYKMLVYEKGAMFKAHTDTEKIPGMFGTMVICLPSAHTGGDVVVKHKGKKMVFQTSAQQPSIISWYSDVHHEVLPVTSGYRWVLTYNLAIPPSLARPSASFLRSETKALRHTLRRWLQGVKQRDDEGARNPDAIISPSPAHQPSYLQINKPKPGVPNEQLYYVLDHPYTEDSLSNGVNALKASDLTRIQCLSSIASELDIDIMLAALEKTEEGPVEGDSCEGCSEYSWRYGGGYYDEDDEDGHEDEDEDEGHKESGWHNMEDICDRKVTMNKLVDLRGRELRAGVDVDFDMLVENTINDCDDPFDNGECGESDYEGYMGNSGPQATHWYRTTVSLLPHFHVTQRRDLMAYGVPHLTRLPYLSPEATRISFLLLEPTPPTPRTCWTTTWTGFDPHAPIFGSLLSR